MSDLKTNRPLLDVYYRRFLSEEHSANFIYSVSQQYTLASLETLTRSCTRMTRRGATLAIGFLGSYRQNTLLGELLHDRDRGVRLLADHGIRQVWMRFDRPTLEVGLRRLVRLNQQRLYQAAIDCADELLGLNSDMAEAWNQRGIALCQLGDVEQAIDDCRRTLDRNPYHFLAALGMGNCYLDLGDVFSSLDAFRTALAINPDLESVRSQIDQLERMVEES